MTAPALPSATILLVRDRPRFVVLMVRRHRQIEFASGALVFPGGKVEEGDRDPAWAGHLGDHRDFDPGEVALRVCAIREAFEESGILLAHPTGGSPEARAARAAGLRAAVASGALPFRELVAELGVRLDLGSMALFAHWVTPAAMPKRFDTRFYLAAAPADQLAVADGRETVDAEWIPPAEALRLQAAGERTIVFPTRLNLGLLALSTSVAEAFEAAAARVVRPIEPTTTRDGAGFLVSIRADLGYGPVEPQRL